MTWLEEILGKWIVRHRWRLVAATILIVLIAAYGLRFLTFNNDLRVFFSKDNPQLKALEELENTYNRIDNVLFVIAPKDGNVFTRDTLSLIEKLTASSWKIPYSSRVDSITNFQHTKTDGDDLIVEDLAHDAQSLSDEDIVRIRQIALSEPSLVNSSVSPSGHVTSVNVNVLLPGKTTKEVPEVVAYVRAIRDDYRKQFPAVDIYLNGAIMFDNAFGEATADDMSILIPAMFIMIIVVIGLTLRSIAGTFSSLIVILFSVASGLGLAGWLGISLNPASASAPTIILVLAVADSVHILSTVLNLMRTGMNRHDAVAESMRINLQPVFLTSITTVIGFLSMNFSDAPPFRDLGNIVAMGVTSALVYSIFFLPAFLAVIPLRPAYSAGKDGASHFFDRLGSFVVRRQTMLFWGSCILIVSATAGITRVELHDDWIKYFDQRYDIRKAADFTVDNLTGFDIIGYSLNAGGPGRINSPEYLAGVESFTDWYRSQPKVVHVKTITDIYKRLNKNMHNDDENYYRIPGQRDLAAQYLLLYEMSLPFGLDLNDIINVDKSATRMIVTVNNSTTKELRQIDDSARQWLKANAPAMATFGSGLSIIWAYISERNINSMLGASVGALVLISLLMVAALRNIKIGLLSLIPNLSPAFMAFGLWGIITGRVGLALSVVVAMTLGIVVDDTIHFLSKYLRGRREYNMSAPDAVMYAFHMVGTAMWVTTAALVAGFLILTLSGFKMNSEMGLLTAITITMALVMDFFFLPVLILKFEGKDEKYDKGAER
ncbi:MAG: efflux RND transporter permease subunit [Nitrospirota bacterium]